MTNDLPEGGRGAFCATDGRGGLAAIGARKTYWDRRWLAITPGNFGGSAYTDLLCYDPRTGRGDFNATDFYAAGPVTNRGVGLNLLRSHTDLDHDWGGIIPGNFGGSAYTDLLFYDVFTGRGDFYTTDGQGGLNLLRSHTGWRKSWTAIIPGNFGGSAYTDLLFYDADAGEGHFYTTDGQGGLNLLRSNTGWDHTWTGIIPGNFSGSAYTELLFYNALTGRVLFVTTDGQGAAIPGPSLENWGPNWRGIIPGNFSDSAYTDLLFHDTVAGRGEFYATDGHGHLTLLETRWPWDWKGWTVITPGNFSPSPYTGLLFYQGDRIE